MNETRVEVNGEELLLDATARFGGRAKRTLIFADLHFEKGSSYARGGRCCRLTTRGRRWPAWRRGDQSSSGVIIALGDFFHDRDAAERLDEHEREMLLALSQSSEWIWIAGNHDPEPPVWLGGRIAEEVAIGGLVFRHEPGEAGFRGEIAGHLHPCATVTRRGRRCGDAASFRMARGF